MMRTGTDAECRSSRPLRVGVFGGTFDPIHTGHLIVAGEAGWVLGLDRVVFVPARVSPLKLGETYFSGPDRLRMVELAIEGNPLFCASRVDLDRQSPSYTVDTLETIQTQYGAPVQLFFIMGVDSLASLTYWHRPHDIVRLAHVIAMSRPGYAVDLAPLEKEIPGLLAATTVVETLQIGISSTEIRTRLRQGRPIKYQVPDAVEAYIRDRQRRA